MIAAFTVPAVCVLILAVRYARQLAARDLARRSQPGTRRLTPRHLVAAAQMWAEFDTTPPIDTNRRHP